MDLSWLDEHSGAVQALATLATLAVTIVLALFTAKYVRLTGRLADAAERQLAALAADKEYRRRRLAILVATLVAYMNGLPKDRAHAEQIRRFPLWTDAELAELQALAAELEPRVMPRVTDIAEGMRYLSQEAKRIRQINEALGVDWNRFDWVEWEAAAAKANRGLGYVEGTLSPSASSSR